MSQKERDKLEPYRVRRSSLVCGVIFEPFLSTTNACADSSFEPT